MNPYVSINYKIPTKIKTNQMQMQTKSILQLGLTECMANFHSSKNQIFNEIF